ncbi:MAG: hypothetical protein ABIG42_02450 [bacterium]
MSMRELIKNLKVEIEHFKSEIKKREDIIVKLMELDGGSTVTKVKGTRKKRGPGRPPVTILKKRGRKPGRPAGTTTKKVVRRQYETPVGEMIFGVLKSMKRPADVNALTEKVHKKYPDLGGVKYRAIVSSMLSRDQRFQRIGKDKVTYKKKRK